MVEIVDETVDVIEEYLEKKHDIELTTKDLDEVRDTLDAVLDKYSEE